MKAFCRQRTRKREKEKERGRERDRERQRERERETDRQTDRQTDRFRFVCTHLRSRVQTISHTLVRVYVGVCARARFYER